MISATKGVVMNKPGKPVKDRPAKQNTSDRQRGIVTVGLLFAASALNAAVVVGALLASKKPPMSGD